MKTAQIETPSGDVLKVRVAITGDEHTQGLSGIRDQDFQNDEAMIFFNLEDGTRNFWMPDTYFDLDIFYLSSDLTIVDIERNLPHHIGRDDYENIPRAKPVYSRHVLELKANSPLAKKIQIGDKLKWIGPYSLEQTEQSIRRFR